MAKHILDGMNLEQVLDFAELHQLDKNHDEELGLILLDYNQINTPKHSAPSWQCRGVIYDIDSKKVVCRPVDRFFNLGESPAQQDRFNWDNFTAFEKVDGSLIKVWFWNGEWHIGTRGTMFADSMCWNTLTPEAEQISFRDLFLRTLGMTSEDWFSWSSKTLDTSFTHLFELCTNENRVVTKYDTDRIYAITSVHNESGMNMFTMHQKEFNAVGIMEIPKHDVSSKDGIQEKANQLRNLVEGFVLWDGHNRIKVKSEIYVAAHHLRGNNSMNPRRALDIVFKGEVDEVLAYFPEWTDYLRGWQDKWDNLLVDTVIAWEDFKHIESQKDFALAIKDLPSKSILFEKRKDPSKTIKEHLNGTRDGYKYSLMGV